MNEKKRGILIGMILGDGHLQVIKVPNKPNSWTQNFCLKHGQNQKEYIEHKANVLHSILGGNKPKVFEINNNGYVGYRMSKSNSYFRILHGWIYKDKVKTYSRQVLNWLTPEGIAYWYMDDGSLYPKKRNGKVPSYELILSTYVSEEQNQVIIDYFADTYDIHFKKVKSKGSYRLRLATKEARKFVSLVEPYIIDSMFYKIDIN